MRWVYLGVGGNVGDVGRTFQRALDRLGARLGPLRVARLYRSIPAGGPPQPLYYNTAVAAETQLTAPDLLQICHLLEEAAGRRRRGATRWGPRPLDLDLLAIEGEAWHSPALDVPHPRATERAFVLKPLHDLAPQLPLRGGCTVERALGLLDRSALDGTWPIGTHRWYRAAHAGRATRPTEVSS